MFSFLFFSLVLQLESRGTELQLGRVDTLLLVAVGQTDNTFSGLNFAVVRGLEMDGRG